MARLIRSIKPNGDGTFDVTVTFERGAGATATTGQTTSEIEETMVECSAALGLPPHEELLWIISDLVAKCDESDVEDSAVEDARDLL